jgi:hypothetical protein
VSPFAIALLVAALAVLVFAEWPRLARRVGLERSGATRPRRPGRRRQGRPSHLQVVEPDHDPEEFARDVERDLARLPTIDDRDY